MTPVESLRVVVTLPVYKDTVFLRKAVEIVEETTPQIAPNFVLLILEDGSDSSQLVNELKPTYRNLVYIQHDQRLGRGKALREGWKNIDGDVYLYIDVDLATDLTKLNAYRDLIVSHPEFDLVTGSRYIPGSETNRPQLRRSASVIYNQLVRSLFRTGIHDHQCGFKSFSRELVHVLSAESKTDSWFWDTEVLVLARKLGFRIREIPVYWTEKKAPRTPLARLMRDVWIHGSGLMRLVWRVYLRPSSIGGKS
jgi:glycosyltransferase involved in cell wall biosynthesis